MDVEVLSAFDYDTTNSLPRFLTTLSHFPHLSTRFIYNRQPK